MSLMVNYDKKLSLYGTVFNSVNTVEYCINNAFQTFSKFSNNIEFIIVDSQSTDGTWEKLKRISEDRNIILYRKKSTRGYGRALAFNKTEGYYTIPIDMDEAFNSDLFPIILIKYPEMLEKDVIFNFSLSRRQVIENAGNWANLNAGEDVELKARLLKTGCRLLGIPIQITFDISENLGIRKQSSGISEKRYAHDIQFFTRLLKYLMDTVRGHGYNIQDLKWYPIEQRLVLMSGLVESRILDLPILRHFEEYSNLEVATLNSTIIDPYQFGIPRDKIVGTIPGVIRPEIIEFKKEQLRKFGSINFIKSGNSIIVRANKH